MLAAPIIQHCESYHENATQQRQNSPLLSLPFIFAALTCRCTPAQKNGHDGGLRWWKVVILIVVRTHDEEDSVVVLSLQWHRILV